MYEVVLIKRMLFFCCFSSHRLHISCRTGGWCIGENLHVDLISYCRSFLSFCTVNHLVSHQTEYVWSDVLDLLTYRANEEFSNSTAAVVSLNGINVTRSGSECDLTFYLGVYSGTT